MSLVITWPRQLTLATTPMTIIYSKSRNRYVQRCSILYMRTLLFLELYITRVVSQLARGNRNLPSLLMGSARRHNYMDNLPPPTLIQWTDPLTQIVSRSDSSNFHVKFNLNITKLAVTKKNMNPKNYRIMRTRARTYPAIFVTVTSAV